MLGTEGTMQETSDFKDRCASQENLAVSDAASLCFFWLLFKKIIHNSKSIGPFDLILILSGVLAHFSQDRLF